MASFCFKGAFSCLGVDKIFYVDIIFYRGLKNNYANIIWFKS